MRIRGRKPSPAMVVAIVALVFAIGGTSVASVATISALSKKEKKQTRSIAKNELNKAAPGLSVAKANVADGLDGVTYVTTESSVPPRPATGESIATGLAPCPPGTKVVGGGVKLVNELRPPHPPQTLNRASAASLPCHVEKTDWNSGRPRGGCGRADRRVG